MLILQNAYGRIHREIIYITLFSQNIYTFKVDTLKSRTTNLIIN